MVRVMTTATGFEHDSVAKRVDQYRDTFLDAGLPKGMTDEKMVRRILTALCDAQLLDISDGDDFGVNFDGGPTDSKQAAEYVTRNGGTIRLECDATGAVVILEVEGATHAGCYLL